MDWTAGMNDNIIQDARGVLARWRDGSTPGPWIMDTAPIKSMGFSIHNGLEGIVREAYEEADTRLIVGTAGNPGLLDAIDALLELAESAERDHRAGWSAVVWSKAEPIAAAIIAANERMSDIKPYSVTVHFTDGGQLGLGCDDVDLDAENGTLTLYGTYANATGRKGRRVYMLRNIAYYDVEDRT